MSKSLLFCHYKNLNLTEIGGTLWVCMGGWRSGGRSFSYSLVHPDLCVCMCAPEVISGADLGWTSGQTTIEISEQHLWWNCPVHSRKWNGFLDFFFCSWMNYLMNKINAKFRFSKDNKNQKKKIIFVLLYSTENRRLIKISFFNILFFLIFYSRGVKLTWFRGHMQPV